jgi:NAD(P)-dependent dehydrogenase (short-subunit alcohol dehydrogenase family)
MSTQKIALITGANRGIGFETARQLGKHGMRVLIGARSEEKGLAAESNLKNEGLDVEYINIDVDDAATHESAAKTIEERYGKLDILVNNAGIFLAEEFNEGVPVPASKTSAETFRKTFDTNFFNTIE